MLNKLKITLAAIITLLFSVSCDDLRDSYDDCGVWLEFVFDHNMEYTDSFDRSVDKVDVLVFDQTGKLYSSHYATLDDLHSRKRMFLGGEGMPVGKYSIVVVGGLTDHFHFADDNGNGFIQGVTTIEQVRLALKFENEVAHEFPHVWFGPATDIEYRADLSVWRIPLIRQTNRFHISLQREVEFPTRASDSDAPLYNFEIAAPEAGAYDHLNRPLARRGLSYHPYSLASSVETGETSVFHRTDGKMNTMRLLVDQEDGYTLAIRNNETGEELWSHDLIDLLGRTKPGKRPDNTPLPLQEYLDREADWNIVVVHNGKVDKGFAVLKIKVNNWVVWNTGAGV